MLHFVDFKKAFDSMHHNKLLQAMQKEGVQGKFFASIKSMYDSLLSCVRANSVYFFFFFFLDYCFILLSRWFPPGVCTKS